MATGKRTREIAKGGSVPAPGGGGEAGGVPPQPSSPPPEGYEWQLQQQGNKWVWALAAVGAVLGYLGQRETNRQNAAAARSAGGVDVTTTRTPDVLTEPYRQAGLQAAYEALFGPGTRPSPLFTDNGQRPGGGSGGLTPFTRDPGSDPQGFGKGPEGVGGAGGGPAGAPRGQGAGGAGGGPSNPGRKPSKPPKPGGGGGGGAAAQPGFAGMSPETAQIRERLMGLQAQNEGLVGAGGDYAERALAGEQTNPLSGRAATAADDIATDAGLEEYIARLKDELGPAGGTGRRGTGGGGSGGAFVSYGYAGADGGAAAQQASGAGRSATGTDQALKDLVAGKLPAGLADQEEHITRRINEARAASIRDLRARAVGSGFYGGDVYKDLEEGAIARGDQELAAELAAGRFGAYQNALGLGTQYDLGMADIAAGDRRANAAASASAGAAAAELASREKLATMGMWGDALGLGQQGRTARAGALGDLASLTSGDQRSALASIPELTGSRRSDLAAAGDLSLGSDVARNQFVSSGNQLAAARAQVGLGRAELAFDRERFYDPFARISAYGDALNSFYGGYGSERTQGQDQRSQSPAPYSSPLGAGLTGAAVGGSLAGAFKRRGV